MIAATFEDTLRDLGESIASARRVPADSTVGKMHRHIALVEANRLLTIVNPPNEDDNKYTVWHKKRFMYSVRLKDGRKFEECMDSALSSINIANDMWEETVNLLNHQGQVIDDHLERTSNALRMAMRRIEELQSAWVNQE